MTQVCDVMTRGVRVLAPEDSVRLAAQAMDELNIGVLPVCDGRRLVGMLTDRDIAIRGVAQGLPAESTPLKQVMSPDVQWCFEDQPVQEAAQLMRDAQVRRLPVVDRDKRLVGMVTLGDVAVKSDDLDPAAQTLADVSQPAEPDRSGQSAASGPAGGGSASGQARGGRMPH